MRRLVTALAVVAAMLAAAASPAAAITWGQPDGEDHPEVVALLFQRPDGFYSCSGTLLSPTVVLTAGHCTEGGGELNLATWVSNDPDPLSGYPGTGILQWLSSDDSGWVRATEVVPHPEYDDFAAFPDTYDIGLVLLPGPGVTLEDGGYGALPSQGYLDTLMTRKGAVGSRQVVVVGYGLQGTVPAFAQDDFLRYQGRSAVTGLGRSDIQGGQTLQTTNSPGKGNGSGGTCFGDSGGPAFWVDPVTGQETDVVVAVTSFGITGQCAGTDFLFRTDTEEALDFVAEYL